MRVFYKNARNTPAVSSINLGSVLIFASCVIHLLLLQAARFHSGGGFFLRSTLKRFVREASPRNKRCGSSLRHDTTFRAGPV